MPILVYRKTALTGGSSAALDGIDGDVLNEGDIGWVYLADGDGNEYKSSYQLDATSGESESSPTIIAPDLNPGLKRWILQRSLGLWGDDGGVRILRASYLSVNDGTDADTLKVFLSALYNGDSAGTEDNLAKGGSTTNFSLNADGNVVTISKDVLSAYCDGICSCSILSNSDPQFVDVGVFFYISSGNITATFRSLSDNSAVDMTAIASSKRINAGFCYVTRG